MIYTTKFVWCSSLWPTNSLLPRPRKLESIPIRKNLQCRARTLRISPIRTCLQATSSCLRGSACRRHPWLRCTQEGLCPLHSRTTHRSLTYSTCQWKIYRPQVARKACAARPSTPYEDQRAKTKRIWCSTPQGKIRLSWGSIMLRINNRRSVRVSVVARLNTPVWRASTPLEIFQPWLLSKKQTRTRCHPSL